MYYFMAHYINMDTSEEIERKIVFDGQFLDNEKQCYLHAMGIAYDMMGKNEIFDNLEFVAC